MSGGGPGHGGGAFRFGQGAPRDARRRGCTCLTPPMPHRKLTILFSGMLAGDPGQGGASWAVLQYVLGLRRLGHDVYFVEPVKPVT